MTMTRIDWARGMFLAGLALGSTSVYVTLSFSWNPAFEAPGLPEGPSHTRYHAFREFTLTLGAIAVMAFAMFQPARRRTPQLWTAMLLAAVFYYAGWWLPGPLLGLGTPSLVAELVHVATAACVLGAIFVAHRAFAEPRMDAESRTTS